MQRTKLNMPGGRGECRAAGLAHCSAKCVYRQGGHGKDSRRERQGLGARGALGTCAEKERVG